MVAAVVASFILVLVIGITLGINIALNFAIVGTTVSCTLFADPVVLAVREIAKKVVVKDMLSHGIIIVLIDPFVE